jgi:hypothetical protein
VPVGASPGAVSFPSLVSFSLLRPWIELSLVIQVRSFRQL